MIVDMSNGKLEEVKATARKMGPDAEESLKDQLDYLDNYMLHGEHPTTCRVFSDFAPHSLYFELVMTDSESRIFNGGIIYSGPGLPSNGSAPSFTVSLDDDAAAGKKHMWSIHT
jgi:hypothetical protein